MLAKLTATALVLIAWTSGAAAENLCGDLPIAPAIPAAPDIARKSPPDAATSQRGAFVEVKKWQATLKSYRDCLNATVNTDKRELGESQRSDKPDTKKITQLQDELTQMNAAWNAAADEEEQVVNEFHAMQTAFCGRNDVDRSSCPKT